MKNSFIFIKFKQSILRNCKNNKKLHSKNKIKIINKNMLIMMMRQQRIQFVILIIKLKIFLSKVAYYKINKIILNKFYKFLQTFQKRKKLKICKNINLKIF